MPGACRGGALQLLRPAVGQAICRQPAEALGCCILRLAPAPWLTCAALCPRLGMAMVCTAPCPALLPVPLCVGAVVGLLDCCLACCFGGSPCCCHAALLHAPVGLVGFGVVQLWLLLSGCYAGWRWLAFAVLLPCSLPCFLLSFFCASPSLPTFYMWRALLHLPRPAPQSMPCFGHCPLASSAFPCLVGRSIELTCPMAGCCRRWRLLPAGVAMRHLLPLSSRPPSCFLSHSVSGVGSLPVHCLLVTGLFTA